MISEEEKRKFFKKDNEFLSVNKEVIRRCGAEPAIIWALITEEKLTRENNEYYFPIDFERLLYLTGYTPNQIEEYIVTLEKANILRVEMAEETKTIYKAFTSKEEKKKR